MPPVFGIVLTLVGCWFLFQAFRRRRDLLSQRNATESAPSQPDSQGQEDASSAVNAELQQFASGCAPVFAGGILLLAMALAAVALVMDGPRRLSIFDILGLLFFAGAYAFSMMMRTYYNAGGGLTLEQAEDSDETPG